MADNDAVSTAAFALLAAAADPAGAHQRMSELKTATEAHDAARLAAEQAAADADAIKKCADTALAELETRSGEFQRWVDTTEANLKQREADVRARESAAAANATDLAAREEAFRTERATYQVQVRDLKRHLAGVEI